MENISDTVFSFGFSEDKVLAIENGGTGRVDGLSQDVIISDNDGQVVSAKSRGQIGNPVYVGIADANELTDTGFYMVNTLENPEENHWPSIKYENLPVKVLHGTSYIYQEINTPFIKLCRRKTIATGNWGNWTNQFFQAGSSTKIYISKNGSDSNIGLSPDYPVLTVDKAMELANAASFNKTDAFIIFCFGIGNWGNITFKSLPYKIAIYPYDGNVPTEYSEELPLFGTLAFYNCSATLTGFVSTRVYSYQNSYVRISAGYRCFGGLQVQDTSTLTVESSTNPDLNICELIDDTASAVLMSSNNSLLSIGAVVFRLRKNISRTHFITCFNESRIILNACTYDNNGFTFIGAKLRLYTGANLTVFGDTTLNSQGIPAELDKLFGTGYGYLSPSTINGIAIGNVNKAGDTITGRITYKALTYKAGNAPSSPIYLITPEFRDKDGADLGYLGRTINSNGDHYLSLSCRDGLGNGITLSLKLNASGQSWAECPTPPASHNTYSIATTQWISQKLGSATSLTTLASIDEADPNYIETPEVKQQKEIAELNSEAQQAIYQDFPYDIDGETYYFGYSLFDQQNLSDLSLSSLINPNNNLEVPCKTSEGKSVFLTVTPGQIQEIYLFGLSNKMNILKEANMEKQNIISNFKS